VETLRSLCIARPPAHGPHALVGRRANRGGPVWRPHPSLNRPTGRTPPTPRRGGPVWRPHRSPDRPTPPSVRLRRRQQAPRGGWLLRGGGGVAVGGPYAASAASWRRT
jgi:hypothetical protein